MRTLSLDELRAAYSGRRVLVTGHTGFKGGWLVLWLSDLGAAVTGYALAPPTEPALFTEIGIGERCRHVLGDVRDRDHLAQIVADTRPEVVFHLAAQSLVRLSYDQPLDTLEVNLMGTANLLETVRCGGHHCTLVVVTSDKCYDNREWVYGYRENDPMGGHDVYSMSKGATELLVSSYRRSFFPPARLSVHGVALASARAGNVIGGGDWATDRLVPDVMRALTSGKHAAIRNSRAVRPWQHVLEPLAGYLILGAKLMGVAGEDPAAFSAAWNFGPAVEDSHPVAALVTGLIESWGGGGWDDVPAAATLHEAAVLRLSIEKAVAQLGWAPRWSFREAVQRTAAWYRAHHNGLPLAALRELTLGQIHDYAAVQFGV
jgi:CDP-glucose 4,6-dehydratase